ncbi:MAG: tyrosine-protein phosphatase [Clostridia bacterium]|nr:tyrosine-protein phosphatase [Clostridia bacterium]
MINHDFLMGYAAGKGLGGGGGGGSGIENVTWHQCPAAVRSYLAEVDYTGAAYTDSDVQNYAPTPAVTANTKPIGKTVDSVTFYNEIPLVKTPFATANKAGTVKPLDRLRWINSATSNMRDLGGWACDGGTVKYGLLFRSGNPAAADEDLVINQLGIRVEVDLTADNVEAFPGKLRYVCHPSYAMYSLADTGAWRTNLRAVFDAVTHGEPVIFHCSMGADRTGTLACVLEGLLGMSQSDIDKDYELTSFYSERARNGNYQGGTSDWAHLIGQIEALSGSTFRDKCVTFAVSLGFTATEINAYRAAMIDGTPETLTPAVPTVTVSKTLAHCTIDNAAASAPMYQPYEAVITPGGGYKLDSVAITMGGVDVKGSVYSEIEYPANRGLISIPRVTGNVVITASATAATENEIPISTDEQGNIYNGTGYKEGYRLNSSGVETAASGQNVTGFIPFTQGKQIFFDGFTGAEGSNGGICFYGANHAFIAAYRVVRMISDGVLVAGEALTFTPGTTVYDGGTGTMKDITAAAYVRFSTKNETPGDMVCVIADPPVNYTEGGVTAHFTVTEAISATSWYTAIPSSSPLAAVIAQHRNDASLGVMWYKTTPSADIGLGFVAAKNAKIGSSAENQGAQFRTSATGGASITSMPTVNLLDGTNGVTGSVGAVRVNADGSVDLYVYYGYPLLAGDYVLAVTW